MVNRPKRLSPFRLWGLASILMAATGTVYLHESGFANWPISWIFSINFSTLLIFAIDKIKAQKGWLRIPEDILLGMSLIGGSIGASLAIHLFRHKSSKKSFLNAFVTIIILQIVVGCIWYFAL